MSKRPITLAAAQGRITPDVRENGREIRRLMEQARSAGARIVQFPEGAMSGCSKAQIKDWGEVDWDAVDSELRSTADLARELDLWVVVGCSRRLTPPHRPYNSLYVISNRGEAVARYDKQYCSHTQITRWHTPGRGCCVFEVDGWRFGCALCIEIQFPELFLEYLSLGVDCILFSAYADDAMFGVQAQGYAASHSYWFSVSTPTQTSHGLCSRLIAPNGEVQAMATPAASGLAVGQLDMSCPRWEIALLRAKPWRARARDGSIYRGLYVQDPRSERKTGF